jgi:uncharacterized protein (TIGR03435 family)
MTRRMIVAALATLTIPGLCIAQTQTTPAPLRVAGVDSPPRLAFEIASVKLATIDDHGPPFELSPNGAVNMRMPGIFLLFTAYGVNNYHLVGTPKWLDSESYRIVAKPSPGSLPKDNEESHQQLAERLQSLLADRFHLEVHWETRELPIYELVVAKDGPKMKEVPADSANFKLRMPSGHIFTQGGGKIGMLAAVLGSHVGREVVDKTGLDGYYVIDLQFSPNDSPDDARPSLFTALQEQLGLKLESRKGSVKVLVVDRIERPSEN